jgi:hypothetical protein
LGDGRKEEGGEGEKLQIPSTKLQGNFSVMTQVAGNRGPRRARAEILRVHEGIRVEFCGGRGCEQLTGNFR